MSFADNPYAAPAQTTAALAAEDERAGFIVKTYAHLMGAIMAFVLIEAVLLSLPMTPALVQQFFSIPYASFLLIGGFVAASWIAESWARSSTSVAMQYLGLSLFVVAEAIIFVPLLMMAIGFDPWIIPTAGITTMGMFAVLTAVVFVTRKDFSFLRSFLIFGGIAAFVLIGVAILFQFSLGPIFTVAMIGFACAYILYDTSNVLHHYRIGQHVAASLALFASVALLFWYVIRLFMSRD